eukprot:GDKI01042012.1.p1 GENE.GDKI01042012.1~~GDKI01042012.1.p1  ORF type:complete len:325 (-),score=94.78 GDKI01042012.1:186-1100(-)
MSAIPSVQPREIIVDKEKFERDGFLVVPNAFTRDEMETIRKRMREMLHDFDAEKTRSTFDTEGQKQKDDDHFLHSGENVRFFFETDVFDEQGKLKVEKEMAVNKAGHAMHDVDDEFRKFSYHPVIMKVLQTLGYKDPSVVQSMYIFKQPFVGGKVTPHQDSTFIHTTPLSVVGTWMGLEDATLENGCLWAVPGSHKKGMKRRFKLNDQRKAFFDQDHEYDLEGAVPVEVKAGSLVLIHGEVVHFSHHNASAQSRHAYALHIVETDNTEYSKDNWLQRPNLPFRKLYEESKKIYGDNPPALLETH